MTDPDAEWRNEGDYDLTVSGEGNIVVEGGGPLVIGPRETVQLRTVWKDGLCHLTELARWTHD